MLQAGARGYLLKNSSKEEIINAVKAIHNKGMYYCHDVNKKMMQVLMEYANNQSSKVNSFQDITAKEKTVIRMICEELSSKEIAQKLNMSSRSIESIRERIQIKSGTKNMAGIVIYAIKYGLFKPG